MTVESATYINDLSTTLPAGGDPKSEGDNHVRLIKSVLKATLPGMAGRAFRTASKSSNYDLTANDNLTTIVVTASGVTIGSAVAASSMGNGFLAMIYSQNNPFTFNPNGSETVNGKTDVVVSAGHVAFVICDGTNWALFATPIVTTMSNTAITGNETLTGDDFSRLRTVTATADVTLPTSANSQVGRRIRVRSTTHGSVRILRNSGQTIDGVAADFRLPSYEMIELEYLGSNDWAIVLRPTSFVGEVRAIGNATPGTGWVVGETAISRTTYAGLFAVVGTTYGAGDGSTTFNPPGAASRALVGAGTGFQTLVCTSVSATANAVAIGANDAWHTGMQVATTNVSGFGGSLTNSTYYIRRTSATAVKFYTTLAAALQDGTPVTITGTGNVTLTYTNTARSAGEKFGHEYRGQHANEVGTHQHTDSFTNPGGGGIGYDGNGGGADVNFTAAWATTETMDNMGPSQAIPFMVKT